MKICNVITSLWFVLIPITTNAQNDTIASLANLKTEKHSSYNFSTKQLIIPTALIGIGIIGLESDWLKYQNKEMRDELQENIDKKITIDDFTQYMPMGAIYGLNFCGIKAKHSIADHTIILGTAYALMGLSVNTMKITTGVERPDGSSRNSFPSGHTATAFM